MVEGVGANNQDATRGPKGAHCIARPTVGASGVCLQGAQRVLRVAHPSARGMVEGSAASLKVVESAQRVFMVGLTTVLHMVVESDVLWLAAPRAPVGALIAASGMVGASGVSLRIVVRAHREAQISARHMVEGSGAHGARVCVRSLQEERVGCVQLMVAWSRTRIR